MNRDRTKFEQWMAKMDHSLVKRCGLGHMDLPDCQYWDWFEEGVSPSQAARDAIRQAQEG